MQYLNYDRQNIASDKTLGVLKAGGEGFQSLNETLDTTTANGDLIFHLFAALTQFERSLIVERTQAALSAKKRGTRLARPPALTAEQIKHAQKLINSGECAKNVAETPRIDRSTLYRAMEDAK